LKQADIGIAMGRVGTDVAREAASMVLQDDNFASIVAAIEEGRIIYDNVRKVIRYLVASNSGEICVMLLAPLAGMPLPLLPVQILWVNLVTDGLPALALAGEPAEHDAMRRPPRSTTQRLLSNDMGWWIFSKGCLLGSVALAGGYILWFRGSASWQTSVFTTLTLSQLLLALAVRSERESFFKQGIFSNKPLIGAVVLTFLLQLLIVYLPLCQTIFHTTPLSPGELAACLALSTAVFWAAELEKYRIRRQAR
jgi:Ca2+-transporting ATPase